MLKCDFHLHTSDDPVDVVRYSAIELIDLAASHGFEVLSITNHQDVSDASEISDYAAEKGILLISGIEADIDKKHVIALNIRDDFIKVKTFEDLRKYKSENPNIFVYAPHPFYPKRHCLGKLLEKYIDVFDGIEYCHFYMSCFNWFNNKALKIAEKYHKPLIANSDSHSFHQFNRTYSLVGAEKNIFSIFKAIKENKVSMITEPIPVLTCLKIFLPMKEKKQR